MEVKTKVMEEVLKVADKVKDIVNEHPVRVALGVATVTLGGYWYW
jgi:hypothetical protein